MTARELIEALQNLGEKNLDKQVLIYDEWRYVNISKIEILIAAKYDETEETFIGIN